MSTILKILSILKGLLDVFYYVREYLESRKKKQSEERNKARDKAIEDSKTAESDDEIWDSQDRIVDNRPKP